MRTIKFIIEDLFILLFSTVFTILALPLILVTVIISIPLALIEKFICNKS